MDRDLIRQSSNTDRDLMRTETRNKIHSAGDVPGRREASCGRPEALKGEVWHGNIQERKGAGSGGWT